MRRSSLLISVGLSLSANQLLAHDYALLFPEGSMRDAMNYERRSDFFTSSDIAFIDGSTQTQPTNSVSYDRSLYSRLRLGTNIQTTANIGLRAAVAATRIVRKQGGQGAATQVANEERVDLVPELALTYLSQGGAELAFGIRAWWLDGFQRNTQTEAVKTVETFAELTLKTPFVAIVKRSGAFDGGVYYQLASEGKRSVNLKNTYDERELRFVDNVQEPSMLALMLRLRAGGGELGASFQAVEAGAGGPRTDDGDTVYEDYIRLQLEAKVPLGTMTAAFGLSHKTLSYADHRNVPFTAMPLTVVHTRIYLGTAASYSYFGLSYGTAKDEQSLPEFNAKYRLSAVAGSVGLGMSF